MGWARGSTARGGARAGAGARRCCFELAGLPGEEQLFELGEEARQSGVYYFDYRINGTAVGRRRHGGGAEFGERGAQRGGWVGHLLYNNKQSLKII